MLTKIKKWRWQTLTVLGIGTVIALGAPTSAETITPDQLSPQRENNAGIGQLVDVPYELKLPATAGGGFRFEEGDNFLEFTPSRIGWDSESKPLNLNASRRTATSSNGIGNRDNRLIKGSNYRNAFGTGIDINLVAYKDLYRKIIKINSLADLGTIPVSAQFLEIEFQVDTNYSIPLVKVNETEDESIDLGNYRLLSSEAWTDTDTIPIESEFLRVGINLLFVKRIPVEWLQNAQYPVYTDQDTTVAGGVEQTLDQSNALWGPYWTDVNTGVIVYIANGLNPSAATTTDAGATWTVVTIDGASGAKQMAAWYDKETPSDTGTLVHVTWLDADDDTVYYVTVDVVNGTLGTQRVIDDGLTVDSSSAGSRVAITKTVGGNFIVALETQTEIEAYVSSTTTASWVAIADPYETATEEDWLLLYPANTADNNDAAGIFWDRSADEISIKMYDDSANTWTETSVNSPMVDDSSHINMDGAIRHSDNHLLFVAHSDDNTITDDLISWNFTVDSISSPTVATTTNVFTDHGSSAQTALLINQQNDDVYVSYLAGGTWQTAVDVVYRLSTDDMSTWNATSTYSENTSADFRLTRGSRSIGDDGGRVQWSFYNDDLTEIFVNLINDVEIAAAAVAGTGGIPTFFLKGAAFLKGLIFIK